MKDVDNSDRRSRRGRSKSNPLKDHPSIVGGLGIALVAFLVQQGLDVEESQKLVETLIELGTNLGIGALGGGYIWGLVSPVNKD